jgi:hypothetical protein
MPVKTQAKMEPQIFNYDTILLVQDKKFDIHTGIMKERFRYL